MISLDKKSNLMLALVITSIGLLATPEWIFSFKHWLLFNTLSSLMMSLCFVRPINLTYTFFSSFIFLGFWGKLVFHFATYVKDTGKGWVDSGNAGRYIEPIGAFVGTPSSWHEVIIVCTSAYAAIILARCLHIYIVTKNQKILSHNNQPNQSISIKTRKLVWGISLISFLLLLLANYRYSFYQIGVNPKVILPYHLNAVISWMITWGGALYFSCLAYYEATKSDKPNYMILVTLLILSSCVALSIMSRSTYLFYGIAYLFGWLHLSKKKNIKVISLSVTLFIAGLLISTVLVQVLRASNYFETIVTHEVKQNKAEETATEISTTPISPVKANPNIQKNSYVFQMLKQTPYLILNRWVGLEALMSVVAYDGKSLSAMKRAFSDSPSMGVDSMFQRISKAQYQKSQAFTFMTLAGPVALLYISDSYLIVFNGLFILLSVLIFFEVFIRKFTSNTILILLSSVSVCFTFSQMTFPYLSLVFLLELAITLLILLCYQRVANHKSIN
jgi:hypothetical protein